MRLEEVTDDSETAGARGAASASSPARASGVTGIGAADYYKHIEMDPARRRVACRQQGVS